MSDEIQTRAQQLIGDFAPKLVSLTDDVLFGDIWARPELSPRDRSLITVAALITSGLHKLEQLPGHLQRARENGLTETELKEVMIHLAFYAGGQGDVSRPGRKARLRELRAPLDPDREPATEKACKAGLFYSGGRI